MHAFLKGAKPPTSGKNSKAGEGSSGKETKIKRPVPWVEKYRPKTVEDVVEQNEVVSVLRECLSGADLPNLLLYGPPGTGKTSTILAAAHQLFGDLFRDRVLELNASDDRGISVIRTKVKSFAQLTASSTRHDGKPCPPFKIIILDEADAMTHAAQAALRRTMEVHTKTTRFCLICNYVSKIIQPITSRCTKFRFKPLKEEMVIERLKLISDTESIEVDEDALKAIVGVSGGDMRRAITTLQSCYRLKTNTDSITERDILEISSVVPPKYLEEFLTVCKSGDYKRLEDFVQDFLYEAFSIAQFFEQMNEFTMFHEGLTNMQKAVTLDRLGQCCFRLHNGGSEYIQIMDFGCAFIVALHQRQ